MIEISASFSPDIVDLADEHLLENGDPRWMVVQDLPTQSAQLIGVFDSQESADSAWAVLQAGSALFAKMGDPVARTLHDQDWRDSYKAHFKASRFGRLHWVPIWERPTYLLPPGDALIWLDPGLAFGTGNHETTRLCCERLVELAGRTDHDGLVIDAGCGSGILALSAAKLGYSRVIGFDNDPEAIQVSRENADLNEIHGGITFEVADLISGLHRRTAAILLANIQADILMRFSAQLLGAVAPGGTLILSGILAREIFEVRAVFEAAAPGWKTDSRIMNEWSDLVLSRLSSD